jgi:hypothetical protein
MEIKSKYRVASIILLLKVRGVMTKTKMSLRIGAIFLVLSCQAALAQTITGTITGTVTDPSGAVVPNVTVKATNESTNTVNTTASNESGVYNLLFLQPGRYSISAEAQGFKTSTAGPIQLEVNQVARMDLQMQVGATSETVEVTAAAPVLQTETASTGETISSNISTAIPLRGRNFAQLTLLVPGVVTTNPQSFESIGHNAGGGRPYVNGNREQSNNFLLDGADINESIDNLIGYQPNIDALQEVRVQTGNMGADFGNANGAVVNMTLKSGTNEFHGNVFWFLQNDELNANGFINNRSRVARGAFKRNIFGGTLGGPVVRNKAFFFIDYQGAKQRTEGPSSASIAPLAWRTGDLSSVTNRQILDPLTNQPFPNNIIPANRIVNPVAKALFADQTLYPAPNNAGVGPLGVTSNFIGSSASKTDNDQADAKGDIRLSDNDNLMGRFSIRRVRVTPGRVALPVFIGTLTTAPTTGGVVNWTRIISPTLVNEARFNFNRVRITDNPTDVFGALGENGNQKLGIPGGQPVSGLSAINLGGTEGLSGIGSTGIASDNITNTFQYGDNLTWQKGSHLVKMGGQAIRYQQNRFYGGNNGILGYFTYNGFKTGSAFADFLLDQLQSKGRGSNTGLWGHRQWRSALFFQDDWKVTPTFTLNLGLRWEYNQPVYEVADRQLNVDIYTGEIQRAGQNGNSRALFNPYWKQYMPRLGFAWSPDALGRRFVIRGGYGITSYMEGTGANLRLPLNQPFFVENDFQYSVGTPGTITTGFEGLIARDELNGIIRAWNPDLRPAFIQQWNFTTEYQFSNTMSLTTGYVGQKGTHLVNPREGNQALPSTSAGDINQRRPLFGVLPLVTQISYTDSSATMNYNALQVTGRKRYSYGLEFIAAYTFSKTMSDNLGYYGAGGGSVATQSAYWQNAYDRRADYGLAFFDVKHNFNLGGVYDLPFGRNRTFGKDAHGAVDAVLGGWQLGYNWNRRSGFPITVTSPGRNNAGGRANRANRYRSLNIVNQTIDNWFGTDPSALPCGATGDNGICAYGEQVLGAFGTAGISTERAPGYSNIDMTVGKNFHFTETNYLQFRAEFFNAFNNVSFGAPNRDTSSAHFGFINAQSNTPRVIQFALKYFF